jgi:hypothetical protein
MQTLIMQCPSFEVFAGGARGPGKTFGMLLDWVNHQGKYKEQAIGLMVRRTYKQLVDTIAEAKKLFIPLGAKWIATGVDYGTFFFPTGAKIRFRYLSDDKDAEEFQGHSYTRVYVEELGNFPSATPILKLMATLRSKPGVNVGFRATGNPGGPGTSWIRSRYITPAPLGMERIKTEYKNPWTGDSIVRDRVYIPGNVQQNPFLGPDYVANLQMQASPKLVRAWLTGDWSIVEGAFFDNFSTDLHVIRPFGIPASWARFRAGDWGSFRPFAVGWFAVVSDDYPIRRIADERVIHLPRGAMIGYREYYGMQPGQFNVGVKLTVEQVADGVLSREMEEPRGLDGKHGVRDGVLDPACFRHESGPSIAERFSNKRVYWREADNTRVARDGAIAGWDLVRHRLDGEDGRPMLFFFDTCVHTIRTLPELQHDENRPEDVDSESEDHLGDMVRYACASRPYIKKVPREEGAAMSLADEHGTVVIDINRLFEERERRLRRGGRHRL